MRSLNPDPCRYFDRPRPSFRVAEGEPGTQSRRGLILEHPLRVWVPGSAEFILGLAKGQIRGQTRDDQVGFAMEWPPVR